MQPDNDEQRDFLAVCRAKWFKQGQKSDVKRILKMLNAGDVVGNGPMNNVYQATVYQIEQFGFDKLNIMPRSWYEWRKQQAQDNKWSVQGLIHALLDRDGLMQHCGVQERRAHANTRRTPDAGAVPPEETYDGEAALRKLGA